VKAEIDLTVRYPHPAGPVWAALTSSDALAAWMAWSWAGGNIDTTVTCTLAPTARTPPGCGCARSASTVWLPSSPGGSWPGYPRILGRRLPAYLDLAAGPGAPAAAVDCAGGRRAYLGAFRSWRQRG
jgi:hypothetical protein